jgi:hypothetical protein
MYVYLPTTVGLLFRIAIFFFPCLGFSTYVSVLSQEQLINTVYLTVFQCYRIFECSFLLDVQIFFSHMKILSGGNFLNDPYSFHLVVSFNQLRLIITFLSIDGLFGYAVSSPV